MAQFSTYKTQLLPRPANSTSNSTHCFTHGHCMDPGSIQQAQSIAGPSGHSLPPACFQCFEMDELYICPAMGSPRSYTMHLSELSTRLEWKLIWLISPCDEVACNISKCHCYNWPGVPYNAVQMMSPFHLEPVPLEYFHPSSYSISWKPEYDYLTFNNMLTAFGKYDIYA